jgi:hypothetical protein
VCSLTAVLLLAVGGWRVSETLPALDLGGHHEDVTSAGSVVDGSRDAVELQGRRVVAEPAAAKRVDIERFVAVVAGAALVLLLVGMDVGGAAARARQRLGRERWRSRGPPLAFVF